ncbi:hypothetical protein E2C01_023456 [Portunus trituberculatus]|uniref:Uncharacterized protein n=1 Tax=Portunus trituberculatus TaxID=210409 RepID=A0A5B7EA12_PORTR|nr:hypothetical protein [Portunus trituberculatus]
MLSLLYTSATGSGAPVGWHDPRLAPPRRAAVARRRLPLGRLGTVFVEASCYCGHMTTYFSQTILLYLVSSSRGSQWRTLTVCL